jgi:alpha-beta hydrolase superfamily lysophospholipase
MTFKQAFGTPSKGWVILLHGLGEHFGRHTKIIQLLNDAGFGVYTFDWRGHGRSSGKKGHANVEYVFDVINEIISEIDDKPFLIGYSLGGLAAIRYAEEYPSNARGVIASAPSLEQPDHVSWFSVKLLKFLGVLVPFISVNNTIEPQILSRNEEAVKRYKNDSLVHDRISLKLARSLFQNIEIAHEKVEKIATPLLILHGTSDTLSPIRGSKKLVKEVQIVDKKLVEFEGAFHELFEDKQYSEKFYTTILNWLKNH